jgi:hypothetical protein
MIQGSNHKIIACTKKIKRDTQKCPKIIGGKLPEDNDPIFRKQAAPSLMYVGSRWNGIPHNFDKNGNNRHIKIA